jgi:hypothetical protein
VRSWQADRVRKTTPNTGKDVTREMNAGSNVRDGDVYYLITESKGKFDQGDEVTSARPIPATT